MTPADTAAVAVLLLHAPTLMRPSAPDDDGQCGWCTGVDAGALIVTSPAHQHLTECAACREACMYCEGDHPWPCPTVEAVLDAVPLPLPTGEVLRRLLAAATTTTPLDGPDLDALHTLLRHAADRLDGGTGVGAHHGCPDESIPTALCIECVLVLTSEEDPDEDAALPALLHAYRVLAGAPRRPE